MGSQADAEVGRDAAKEQGRTREPKGLRVSEEKKEKHLQRLREYFSSLMAKGFSGKVTVRLDNGTLQEDIRQDENAKLNLK